MDRRVDLLIALLVIAAGVFVIVMAQGIRSIGPVVDPLGPKAIPNVVGTLMVLGGAGIAISRVRRWRREPGHLVENEGEPDERGVPASSAQAALMMALTFGYVVVMPYLGYPIVTLLFIAGALRVMRVRSWAAIVLTAVIYTVVTYLVFARVVNVNFPLGPLADALRSLGLAR